MSGPTINDNSSMADLLVAVGAGRDVKAFELLFRYYAPRLKSYMSRAGGDPRMAEELMQETMTAVWNKAAGYNPAKGAVSTWIFTIARNLRIDTYRRERRPDFNPEDPAFVPEESPAVDAAFEQQESASRLHEAMAELPRDQAELLKLSFFEDRSHSAIATSLGLPLGTVKSRIRLAFAKLRMALADSGDKCDDNSGEIS
jgi:RNA polymerase sigma-70 factor (ECF subfamily)